MNKNQKYALITGVILITVAIIYWFIQGGEVFTKTKILVDKTTELNRMLGIENKQYIDKFIFGLFPSGTSSVAELLSFATISGLVVALFGIFIYVLRTKKKESK